jgi:hypothetical protein
MHAIAFMVVAMAGLMPAQTPILSFTATTDNVAGAHDSIRIDVLRWSTDAERDQLLSAWNLTAPPVGRGGRGGRGAGGRGRGPTADPAPDPSAVENDAANGGGNPFNGGRGAAGRAGRGGRGGRGGGAPEAPPPTPEGSLTAALANAPTVGHLWSSEVAGYALRSAVRLPGQDGGERIILITDRRLGAWNEIWKPAGSEAITNYEFSVIELHLNSKGEGEGKVSLTGKVAVDGAAKTIALENYTASPVVLKNVRRK